MAVLTKISQIIGGKDIIEDNPAQTTLEIISTLLNVIASNS